MRSCSLENWILIISCLHETVRGIRGCVKPATPWAAAPREGEGRRRLPAIRRDVGEADRTDASASPSRPKQLPDRRAFGEAEGAAGLIDEFGFWIEAKAPEDRGGQVCWRHGVRARIGADLVAGAVD